MRKLAYTGREFARQGWGNDQSYSPSNYSQSPYHIQRRTSEQTLALPPIEGKVSSHFPRTTINRIQTTQKPPRYTCERQTEKQTLGEGTTTGGCGPCNKPKCSWCTRINKTSTFTGAQEDIIFDIYHVVNCQSTWVIYIIECNICNLQYVGKSETGFNIRLNNHRNHIKKAFCSCEITQHFLLNLELIALTMTSPLQLSSK